MGLLINLDIFPSFPMISRSLSTKSIADMQSAAYTYKSSSVSQSAAPGPDTLPCHVVFHILNLLPTSKETRIFNVFFVCFFSFVFFPN